MGNNYKFEQNFWKFDEVMILNRLQLIDNSFKIRNKREQNQKYESTDCDGCWKNWESLNV